MKYSILLPAITAAVLSVPAFAAQQIAPPPDKNPIPMIV
jgi:hypothetical protein